MRVEQSSISQTGDSPLQRRFTYPKPRLALRWDADENDQLRLSLSREVGQLDFADFVASASLDTGHGQRGQRRTGTGQDLAPGRGLGASPVDRCDADAELDPRPDRRRGRPGAGGHARRCVRCARQHRQTAAGTRWRWNCPRHWTASVSRAATCVLPCCGAGAGSPIRSPARAARSRKRTRSKASIELDQDLPALRMNWGIEFEHIAERETKYRFDEVSARIRGRRMDAVRRAPHRRTLARARRSHRPVRPRFRRDARQVRRPALDLSDRGNRTPQAGHAGLFQSDFPS